MSVELGLWLKQCRLDRNMTLEELEEVTKIRKRYLVAIEEGDYGVLPGTFYVRAFVKSYAEAVGLDPNETLKFYRNVLPQAAPEPAAEPVRRRTSAKRSERFTVVASTVLMISFVLLIVSIAYYFISANQEPKQSVDRDPITNHTVPPQDATPTPKSETPSPTPTPTPTPSAMVVKQQSVGRVDNYDVAGVDKISLVLKVTGDECWVRISKVGADGIKLFEQGIFKNGDTKEWEFDTSVQVVLGKPTAVEVSVDEVLLDTGKVASRKDIQLNLLPAGVLPSATPATPA